VRVFHGFWLVCSDGLGEKMAPAPINMAQSGAQFTSFCRKLPMILCKKTGGLPVFNGLIFCL
jgi:hypothetical protein